MRSYTHAVSLSLACLCSTFTLGAVAADASAAPEAVIEEIIVTSQRREENLQSVPLAITAFSNESLRTQGIDSLTEVATRTPGLSMGTFNIAQPQLFIRGIGSNDDGPGADSSVIVFVDEVYIGRQGGTALDLHDLERVEVLRGPQGTLYGKNVVGGAINMVTRKPDEELRASLEGTYGNLDLTHYRGFVSGQIAENVFGKVAFSSKTRDGYLRSQADDFPGFFPSITPEVLGELQQLDINTDSIRANLRFTPTERLELNFSADHSELDQSGPSRHAIGGNSEIIQAGLIPGYANKIHENIAVDAGVADREVSGFMGRLDYDFDFATFTSISAFRTSDAIVDVGNTTDELTALLFSSPTTPAFASSVPGDNNTFRDEGDQFSQEFRLTSTSEGPFNWVVGAYFLSEDNERVESFSLGVDLADGAGSGFTLLPVTTGTSFQENETTSYAAFGQIDWDITARLGLSIGGRYTTEDKDYKVRSVAGGLLILESFAVERDDTWSEFTPKASLNLQLTEDIFLYGGISKGYKSGGYGGSPPALVASEAYDKEVAWLYEVGAKTQWFDNRLRLNLATFLTDYEDLQVFQLLVPNSLPPNAPGVLIAQNASDAQIQGAELEFTIVPIANLTLSGSYTYLDTEYVDFIAPSGFRTPGGADPSRRDGNALRNAPRHAWNVLALYEITMENGGIISLQADVRRKTRVYQDPDLEKVASIPRYNVIDARVSYLTPNGAWEFALWSKNLDDENYLLHNFPAGGSGLATPAPPRTYGATLTWTM